MDQCDIAERPLPKPSDFTGSPFRMLPRIGDKMYRPSRPVDGVGTNPQPPAKMESLRRRQPGVWDWG
ncbi:MAG: hypothetical protein ACT6Q8_05020 [Niveispirillum sp.]|uniref:hypothetical protein n=1 Tax=Niveispirillum sp. TaxID=1917217 RepID=UPI0040365318